jgi:hypothetical protein
LFASFLASTLRINKRSVFRPLFGKQLLIVFERPSRKELLHPAPSSNSAAKVLKYLGALSVQFGTHDQRIRLRICAGTAGKKLIRHGWSKPVSLMPMVGRFPGVPYSFGALRKTFGPLWIRCDVCRRYARLLPR